PCSRSLTGIKSARQKGLVSSACDASDHLGRKYLFRVHGIERVLAVAEFASDFHRSALIYDGVNFVVAEHSQHVDNAVARAGATEAHDPRFEHTDVFLVE